MWREERGSMGVLKSRFSAAPKGPKQESPGQRPRRSPQLVTIAGAGPRSDRRQGTRVFVREPLDGISAPSCCGASKPRRNWRSTITRLPPDLG